MHGIKRKREGGRDRESKFVHRKQMEGGFLFAKSGIALLPIATEIETK